MFSSTEYFGSPMKSMLDNIFFRKCDASEDVSVLKGIGKEPSRDFNAWLVLRIFMIPLYGAFTYNNIILIIRKTKHITYSIFWTPAYSVSLGCLCYRLLDFSKDSATLALAQPTYPCPSFRAPGL